MHDTVDSAVIDEHEQAITTNWIDRSAELLGLVGSHIALLAAWLVNMRQPVHQRGARLAAMLALLVSAYRHVPPGADSADRHPAARPWAALYVLPLALLRRYRSTIIC